MAGGTNTLNIQYQLKHTQASNPNETNVNETSSVVAHKKIKFKYAPIEVEDELEAAPHNMDNDRDSHSYLCIFVFELLVRIDLVQSKYTAPPS